jgi:pseudouridine-5'-phosphate glycosidase
MYIQQALSAAENKKIKGKEITPFLLQYCSSYPWRKFGNEYFV